MGFFITLLLWAVVFALSELLKPKPNIENAKPAGIGDFDFPTATQGRVVPLLWGTVKLQGPNVVWYGDLLQKPIKVSIKTGMFSSTTQITGYRYYLGVQFGLCRGPIDKLLKIWVGDELLWDTGLTGAGTVTFDEPKFLGGDELGAGGISGTLRFHNGTSTQAINTYLSAFQAEGGDTPAYRNTAYAVLEGAYLGNTTSIQPWKFEVQRIPNGLSLGTPTVNTYDANLANVIYEVLTNTEWGLGFPASDIDTTNFETVADVLRLEGNGYSRILDREMEIVDFLNELEQQMDGIVILNRNTGKWQINLARGGYVVDDLPLADESTVLKVDSYSKGTWEETSNIVSVGFNSRDNDYQQDFAGAQDSANISLQGTAIPVQIQYPGVKNRDLANEIAWRELRGISRPLAKAQLTVDRSFYSVNPGDVIAWSDTELGIVKLPMRITKADLGTLQDGKIVLSVVEDIYTYETPSFAAPEASDWVPPSHTIGDIATADRVAFEAPKAIADRDPLYPGVYRRVLFGARYQGDGAVTFGLVESTSEVEVASGIGFTLAGRLNSALAQTAQNTTIEIEPNPDTKADLLAEISSATLNDIGKQLANIALVGSEFIGFTGVTDLGSTIRLDGVRRGLMDSAIAAHADETRVWFLSISAGLTDSSFSGASVSLKPIPVSSLNVLAPSSATATVVSLSDRHLDPYPPVNLLLNSSSYPSSVDESTTHAGGADDTAGIKLEFTRRDYRTKDEVAAVTNESSLPSDFPTANDTRYSVEVIDDPDGSPTSLFTIDYFNDGSVIISRTEILRYMDGVIPSTIQIVISTRHTVDTVDIDSPNDVIFDVDITDSELTGLFNFGTLDESEVSAAWTSVPDTGTYSFTIAQDVITGGNLIQGRINGGSWTTIMSAGQTSGNLVGVTAGDTIEIRHGENSTDANQTIIKATAPTAGLSAYGILVI